MSQAHYILSSVHLRAGRIRQLEETARRGLVHAHRSGDLRELLGAPWWIVFALLAGPTPVPAGLQACEELVDAGGLEHIGVLAAMGHFKASGSASASPGHACSSGCARQRWKSWPGTQKLPSVRSGRHSTSP